MTSLANLYPHIPEEHLNRKDTAVPPTISPTPDPAVRTLKVEILTNNSNSYAPLIPNAREPTPFETEFFKGHAMLIIRTKPVDPFFYQFFHGRKRMFEVQVQGKFKREPAGEIFVGAETVNKMELGILTRSISNVVLRFVGTLVNDLHYSLGDSQDDPNHQLPHIVAPIFPTFDKILVTPPGEPLPPMGLPFEEDAEYRKKRLKQRLIKDAEVDLETTYSFSVNTHNLDLLQWTLQGIPMIKPMDLRMFFNSPIQLIGYEVPRSVSAKFPSTHPQKLLNYVFCMRMTSVDPDSMPLVELPGTLSSDEEPEADAADDEDLAQDGSDSRRDFSVDGETVKPIALAAVEEEDDDNDSEDDVENSDEDEKDDQDKSTSRPGMGILRRRNDSGQRTTVSGWLRKKFTRKGKAAEDVAELPEVNESSEYIQPEFDTEAVGDLGFSPACIEINDYRSTGKRRHCYVMPLPEGFVFDPLIESTISAYFNPKCPRLRTYSELAKVVTLVPIPKMHKNKRLSMLEKRRRQVVESYKAAIKQGNSASLKKFNSFLGQVSDIDRHFLGGNVPVQERPTKDHRPSWEGYVALAMSRRHFSEQYMMLSNTGIVLKRHQDSRREFIRIPLEEIVSVQSVPHEQCPMQDFGFLQIETYARFYYLLVRSDMQVNDWLQAFIVVLGKNCMNSRFRIDQDKSQISLQPKDSFEREEIYIARPACWKMDKRRVYNYRRILFKTDIGGRYANIHPNDLIASILSTAFILSQTDHSTKATEYDWIKFWDEISLLQALDLSKLTETERMTFFLNLYHVMVLHGCLVYGPPPAWNHWNAFFNQISYIVDFELLSIAEIEYCILRAPMARSSLFTPVAMTATPQTSFPGLALTHRDFRLHFAVNNGSCSQLEEVPIYTPERLDHQLDDITKMALDLNLDIDLAKKIVTLPKLPLSDYSLQTGALASKSSGSTTDCLCALAPYLSKTKKAALLQLLADPQHLTIKYRNVNFKCRIFKKYTGVHKVSNNTHIAESATVDKDSAGNSMNDTANA